MIRSLRGHKYQVCAVALTPDGHRIISGSLDRTLRVWDLETRETKTTLQGHTDPVTCRGSHPRWSSRGLGVRRRHGARLGPGDGGNQNEAPGPHGLVMAVAVTPDGRRVVSWSYDHTRRVWDLVTAGNQNDAPGPHRPRQGSSNHPRRSPRGLRLSRPHGARLGPGDGGNQNDAEEPYRPGQCPESPPMVVTWCPAPRTTRCAFGI